ncbi:hypothetical protein CY34DRAFT_743927 [Suillus luteus UH-Slu-Lm8-n1]|uniref:Uncharacterized protein n=1 Tax=Suillus luteus UH-Slu-Lm8-n1 TaxID=930992 RepID=A0A0D0AM67_9AGAM|nr:hypothetical protein CY34DRAFT_743927 [Suillus luteus UH-Slu-Lm8-n1]
MRRDDGGDFACCIRERLSCTACIAVGTGFGSFRLVLIHCTWHATTLPTIQIIDILLPRWVPFTSDTEFLEQDRQGARGEGDTGFECVAFRLTDVARMRIGLGGSVNGEKLPSRSMRL